MSGAKNAALPMLAASLLTDQPVTLSNVPNIQDVRTLCAVLGELGAEVTADFERNQITVIARNVSSTTVAPEMARRARASFLVVGPLVSRFGAAKAPHPGGCDIGKRPVNVDIKGLLSMGAKVEIKDPFYCISTQEGRLLGRRMYLDYPSHTGTENLMMAACLARGTTVITHASAEPEVNALGNMLQQMGARIEGLGTSTIVVQGVERLGGVSYTVIPDRIEAGTFAIAAAISGGDVVLDGVVVRHMDPISYKLSEVGVQVEDEGPVYRVVSGGDLVATELQTLPFPGFPTDLQACFATLLTQASGESIVHERVYENRLLYASELEKMGANIQVTGQSARILGATPLHGATVKALDLRAGAALVLASLCAQGTTIIEDVKHLERGYENLVGKLTALGAHISREE